MARVRNYQQRDAALKVLQDQEKQLANHKAYYEKFEKTVKIRKEDYFKKAKDDYKDHIKKTTDITLTAWNCLNRGGDVKGAVSARGLAGAQKEYDSILADTKNIGSQIRAMEEFIDEIDVDNDHIDAGMQQQFKTMTSMMSKKIDELKGMDKVLSQLKKDIKSDFVCVERSDNELDSLLDDVSQKMTAVERRIKNSVDSFKNHLKTGEKDAFALYSSNVQPIIDKSIQFREKVRKNPKILINRKEPKDWFRVEKKGVEKFDGIRQKILGNRLENLSKLAKIPTTDFKHINSWLDRAEASIKKSKTTNPSSAARLAKMKENFDKMSAEFQLTIKRLHLAKSGLDGLGKRIDSLENKFFADVDGLRKTYPDTELQVPKSSEK